MSTPGEEDKAMKISIVVYSDDLTREDIVLLLQGIRDCEQKSFPQKEMGVFLFAPALTTHDAAEIMATIKPPFTHGPLALGRKPSESAGLCS